MAGRSPWYLAYRRLRRNRVALAFGGLFVAIVVFVLAAPLWADDVAHTAPNATHTLEKVEVDGEQREVVNREGKPIGPLWLGAGGKFFLGADGRLGRDEMVRLMYGGRTSLFIGFLATLIATLLATTLGLLAGYYRGWADAVISRTMDVIWAFPVTLLAIALGLSLAIGGLTDRAAPPLGQLDLDPDPDHRLRLHPLHGAADPRRGARAAREGVRRGGGRPGRGAAAGDVRRAAAQPRLDADRLLHPRRRQQHAARVDPLLPRRRRAAAEHLLGNDDRRRLRADLARAPLLTVIPGTMILLTVLSVNVFGDGLRDALDPKSKVRLEAHAGMVEPEGTAV